MLTSVIGNQIMTKGINVQNLYKTFDMVLDVVATKIAKQMIEQERMNNGKI